MSVASPAETQADAPVGAGALAPRTRGALGRRLRAIPAWAVLAAAVAGAFVALALVGEAFGTEPSGPPSSSYATDARGLAAWAQLLRGDGRRVSQLRLSLARARLDPRWTLVVLDPEALLPTEGEQLLAFVRAGGRLVFGGSEAQDALPALLAHPPRWSGSGARRAHALAHGAATLAGVSEVRGAGEGEWAAGEGRGIPLLGGPRGSLLLERRLGAGAVELLADASPLQNRLLADADNAQLALEIVGAPARPVVFVESVHGFGERRGLAAIPARWRLAFVLLALAGALWALARGRRLGPAEHAPASAVPPRAAYVQALTLLLRRTGAPSEISAALTRLRDRR
ncbi:MAG TPA: DUF4350 domain-containing protein [Solirubrobacteraceae bacterium]|nr:DUF4350 domain-containing protein [Solirubrobacteraceae bacterium]